jgi:hypothetical protein
MDRHRKDKEMDKRINVRTEDTKYILATWLW